jgi:hypothetical protein
MDFECDICGELQEEINGMERTIDELEAAIPRWISVEQPPEPCEAEEYEVWLYDPVDDGDYSAQRMFALYIKEWHPHTEEWFTGWLDRDGNELDVTHYRTLPAPPVV